MVTTTTTNPSVAPPLLLISLCLACLARQRALSVPRVPATEALVLQTPLNRCVHRMMAEGLGLRPNRRSGSELWRNGYGGTTFR